MRMAGGRAAETTRVFLLYQAHAPKDRRCRTRGAQATPREPDRATSSRRSGSAGQARVELGCWGSACPLQCVTGDFAGTSVIATIPPSTMLHFREFIQVLIELKLIATLSGASPLPSAHIARLRFVAFALPCSATPTELNCGRWRQASCPQ